MADNGLQLQWGEQMVAKVRAGRMTRRDLLRRGTVIGLSMTTVSQLLAACAGGDDDTAGDSPGTSGSSGVPTPGGTLRMGAFAPPRGIEPVAMRDTTAIAVAMQVMEYLAYLEPDLSLRPVLATGWEPAQDGAVWTFTLRDGVTFSDGTPLDEAAVVASFDRLLDPANTSAALSAVAGILSAGGVAAGADGTVVFTLDRPFGDFPYIAGAGNYNALITKADYAGDFTTGGAIGTGPFLLERYDQASGATLVRNPSYWDAPKPHLERVEWRWVADDQAGVIALQAGELDGVLTAEPLLAAPLDAVDRITLDEVPSTGLSAVNLRVDTPPFDQVEVRQAIAYAIDREAVLERLLAGAGEVGNDHLFAPAFPAAPTGIDQRAVDHDEVRRLLASVQLTPADVPLTLSFDTAGSNLPQILRSQLEAVGFPVTLEGLSSDVFYGGDQERDTPWLFRPISIVEWAGRPIPSQFLVPMVTSGGIWNSAKYRNPELDAAVAAYDAATTDADRAAQAEIIATTLHEDTPVMIPTFGGSVRAFDAEAFDGLSAHPSQYLDLTGVFRRS